MPACIWVNTISDFFQVRARFSNHTTWPQSRQSAEGFLQSSELGLPQPLTRRQICPPPLWYRGEGTLAGERGGWKCPNSDEGTYTVVLCLYVYFVNHTLYYPHGGCCDYGHRRSEVDWTSSSASPSSSTGTPSSPLTSPPSSSGWGPNILKASSHENTNFSFTHQSNSVLNR